MFHGKWQTERFDPFYPFTDKKVFNGMSTTVFMDFDPRQDDILQWERRLKNSSAWVMYFLFASYLLEFVLNLAVVLIFFFSS